MLPKINGYEVCRLIRREKLAMPIIMLTAKGEESDIVLGLNLGADDYVTKPFSIKELLARAEALLRRTRKTEPEVYQFGDCRLDLPARKFTRKDEEIELSPKEFRLLELFVKRPGRALTRDEILNLVWGYDSFVGSRSIDRFVTTLRNKIEPDPHNPVYIHTVREIGYKFEPPQGSTRSHVHAAIGKLSSCRCHPILDDIPHTGTRTNRPAAQSSQTTRKPTLKTRCQGG